MLFRKFATSLWLSLLISLPSTSTVPPEIVSIELNTLSKVVLPDPEGPMTATNSPFSTEKLILFKARYFCL